MPLDSHRRIWCLPYPIPTTLLWFPGTLLISCFFPQRGPDPSEAPLSALFGVWGGRVMRLTNTNNQLDFRPSR